MKYVKTSGIGGVQHPFEGQKKVPVFETYTQYQKYCKYLGLEPVAAAQFQLSCDIGIGMSTVSGIHCNTLTVVHISKEDTVSYKTVPLKYRLFLTKLWLQKIFSF